MTNLWMISSSPLLKLGLFCGLLLQVFLTSLSYHGTFQVSVSQIQAIQVESDLTPQLPNDANVLVGLSSDVASQLQARIQSRIQSYLRQQASLSQTTNDNNKLVSPPYTPGAFLHIGKTAGGTLGSQLENGCHSFVPKPCLDKKLLLRNSNNETSLISQTTSYFHVPVDMEKLSRQESPYSNYSFYVVSTRDPLERFLSAFTFEHPLNTGSQKPGLVRAYSCFPTLEEFTHHLTTLEHPYDYIPMGLHGVNHTNCTSLARAMMDGKTKYPMHVSQGHDKVLHKNARLYKNLDESSLAVLSIRKEHLWQDWTSANIWLGQEPNSIVTPRHVHQHGQQQEQLMVNKQVSALGQERLCQALQSEYQAYLELLRRSLNLSRQEKNDSLTQARANCPKLALLQRVSFV